MTETNPQATTDTVLRALADRGRRRVVRLLMETDGSLSLDDLVDRLVAGDDPEAALRVGTVLHHQHLPVLHDATVVAYDSAAGTVEYRPSPFAEAVLAACPDGRADVTTPFGE